LFGRTPSVGEVHAPNGDDCRSPPPPSTREAKVAYSTGTTGYFKFNIPEDKIDHVTVSIDGETYTADDFQVCDEKTYMVYTDAIYASQFEKIYTVILEDDDRTVQTLTYSIKSYVNAMQNSTNEKMVELARALWCYGMSSAAYFEL